ncbi:MAG: hypothetical protein JXC32_19210 [Anaerolineae bacterium]|nr:hypothetical protein [Anaerolineae bacterium]
MNQQPEAAVQSKRTITIYATITGYLAIIAAFFAFFNYDWSATGLCLSAAGLTFGLLAMAR